MGSQATLKLGSKAPQFRLTESGGTTVSLEDLLGKIVVLVFYIEEGTPACTREILDFQDKASAFKKLGTSVFGISDKPLEELEKFRKSLGLGLSMLVDADSKVAEAYGVVSNVPWYGRMSDQRCRTTVLVDEEGKVLGIWRPNRVEEHVQEVLDFLIELKSERDAEQRAAREAAKLAELKRKEEAQEARC